MNITFLLPYVSVLVITGLKTVIGELPPASSSLAANICRRITGRLTNAISKVGNDEEKYLFQGGVFFLIK